MFTVARAVLGFGIPMAIVSASSLIGELAYPKERPYLGSLFNALWYVIRLPNYNPFSDSTL